MMGSRWRLVCFSLLSWSLLCGYCSVASASSGSAAEQFEDFLSWLQSHGVNKALKLDLEEFEGYGRGLLAVEDIEAGEVLFSVPQSLAVSLSSSLALPAFASLSSSISGSQRLALRLLYEKYNSKDMQPWLDVFPPLTSFNHHPLLWDGEEELSILSTSPWTAKDLNVSHQSLLQLRETCKNLSKQEPELFPAEACSEEETLSAFLLSLTQGSIIKNSTGGLDYLILPLANLMNHDDTGCTLAIASVEDIFQDGIPTDPSIEFAEVAQQEPGFVYQVTATQAYKRGDQVFLNYGSKSASQFLVQYGFIPSRDQFKIAMTIATPSNNIFDLTIQALQERVGCKRPEPFMMTFGKDAGLADLIFCMRLTELSPHDYELLTSRIQKLQGENFSAANVISIRNEQRAIRALAANIQSSAKDFPPDTKEDQIKLRRKLPPNVRSALTLRSGEHQLFVHALEVLKQHWFSMLAHDFSSEKYD